MLSSKIKLFFWGKIINKKNCVIFPFILLLGCQSQLVNDSSSSLKSTEGYSAEETNKLFVVDCLLPGQIRKLGNEMTYLTARRPIKTTAGNCEIRGGEYVAYDRANYASALKVWLPQAKEGDAEAQVVLGEIYEKGLGGGVADPQLAAQWYKKAAAQGSSRAQINLGNLYEKGLGVEKNLTEALNWYRKASGLENTDLEFASVTESNVSAKYDSQLEELRKSSMAYKDETDRLNQELTNSRQSYTAQQKKLSAIKDQLERSEQKLNQEKSKKDANQEVIKKLEENLQIEKADLLAMDKQIKQLESSVAENRKNVANLDAQGQESIALTQGGIEIIDPPMVLTRGMPSYQLRSISQTKKITGKVSVANDLQSLTINGQVTEVDKEGVFQSLIEIQNEVNPVKIVATYHKGNPGLLSFNLLSKDLVSESLDQNPPAVAIAKTYPTIKFGRFYALIIGNQNYQQLPTLQTSVNDAKAVDEILRTRYNYKTTLLINANRHQVMTAFNDLREMLTEDDNLLIYYAGHGEINKSDLSAYWLPTDAELNNSANWLSSHSLTEFLNIIAAKHILVIADSCYSGAMTETSIARLPAQISDEKRKKWLEFMVKRKARTVMTSGGVQPVLDSGGGGEHSVFANAFIKTLKQNEGLMEDYELFREISGNVTLKASLMGFQQEPQYSSISHAGHEGSPFFFIPAVK